MRNATLRAGGSTATARRVGPRKGLAMILSFSSCFTVSRRKQRREQKPLRPCWPCLLKVQHLNSNVPAAPFKEDLPGLHQDIYNLDSPPASLSAFPSLQGLHGSSFLPKRQAKSCRQVVKILVHFNLQLFLAPPALYLRLPRPGLHSCSNNDAGRHAESLLAILDTPCFATFNKLCL